MPAAQVQGIINILSGLWPLVNLRSFEAVTGRKQDRWLVKTIGWLFVLSGYVLLRSPDKKDAARLGMGWAAIIGGADVYYGGIRHRISRIYLLDVPIQMAIITAWVRHGG